MNAKRTFRPLIDVIREISETAKTIYAKCHDTKYDGAEILKQLHRATSPADCFVSHYQALDGLAHALLNAQMYREAAKITGCTLDLMNGVRAAPLDGPEVLIVHCYLLAKYAHASSQCGDFSTVLNADQDLGRALMAVLRSEADFPVTDGGIKALSDHLVSATCAPPIPLLLTFTPSADAA